jgi:hypothetical protein
VKQRTGLPALILILVGVALAWRALVPASPPPPHGVSPRPSAPAAPWTPSPAIVELGSAWDPLPGAPTGDAIFVLSGSTLGVVQLDTGSVRAMDVGAASADVPFPLLALDGWLVYRSHGRTTTVRPDLVTLGGAGWPSLWFVPSGRLDRVWDVFAPGGGWAGTPASVTQTLLGPERRGPSIDTTVLPRDRLPLAGWGDRLVLGSAQGIEVWDPGGGSSTPLPLGASLVAAEGTRLAWCERGCTRLHLVDASASGDRLVSAPADGARFGPGGAFSPDGESLAMSIVAGQDEGRSTVAVVDWAFGAIRAAASTPIGRVTSLAWAPSGGWLFVAVDARRLVAIRATDGLVHPVGWQFGNIDALASM